MFYSELSLKPSSMRAAKSERQLKKIKFAASPTLKRPELDSGDALKELLGRTKEKFSKTSESKSIGPEARLEFFESFKQVSKMSKRFDMEKSAKNAYLRDISSRKLIPKPFGMIKSLESDGKIDLHLFSMGDEYARAFSEGLKHFKSLETLNLRSNRLSDKGSYLIMSTLDLQPIRYLSLCDNIIGEKALDCLFTILKSPKQVLKHLNLENTRLPSPAVNTLATILSTNKSLTYLSLARNNLNYSTSKSLKEMLHYNDSLKVLDLHWNCLKAEGASLIFEGLLDNSSLKELDLSWNAIGNARDVSQVIELSDLVSRQHYLRHLDLSHNYIIRKECEALATSLANNHLLMLHMSGNECEVDAKGFIVTATTQAHAILQSSLLTSVSSRSHSTNCWTCEGWVQVFFTWTEELSGRVQDSSLFIHLECDSYIAEIMEFDGGVYTLAKAIPPGKQRFFFSSMVAPMKSAEYSSEILPSTLEIEVAYSNDSVVLLKVFNVNYVNNEARLKPKIKDFVSKPREPRKKYQPPKHELIKIPWNVGISLFKDYRLPNESQLQDCFEFDWQLSRLVGFVKNPLQQEQLKELLRSYYTNIFAAYRHLSATSGLEIFSVGPNALTEFLISCKAIDPLFKPSDLGVNWSATKNAKEKDLVYNPGNALVRYEFMEVLVRIAYDRFVRNRICSNVVDATRKFFTEFIIKNTEKFHEYNQWRIKEYMNEGMDTVYKAHKGVMEFVFKKYSGRKTLPGCKPFMSIEEFRELCRDARLENDRLNTREIDLIFGLSMMVQVDEVYVKRHMEMSFVEFLEAFARACATAGGQGNYLVSEREQVKMLFGNAGQNNVAHTVEGYMRSCYLLMHV